MEILPKVDSDPINNARVRHYNSGSGSNHPSSMKGKEKIILEVDDVEEQDSQLPESLICGNFGWETQIPETQFSFNEDPETHGR